MRSLVSLVAAVTTWMVVHAVTAPASADVYVPFRAGNAVKGVALDGRNLPMTELRLLLGTRAGTGLDERQLELDREAITTTLVARGYLAAKANASVTATAAGMYVVFDVDTGPMFHVREIEVSGPAQKYEATVMFLAGEEANEDRIARARRLLTDTLSRSAHGKIAIDVTLIADPALAVVDIELGSRTTTLTRR